MNKIKTCIFICILVLSISLKYTGTTFCQPFIFEQYNRDDYKISQGHFRNGDIAIEVIEAKKISKIYKKPPHACRAWLYVMKGKQIIFQRYFNDIDPVGFSYGLFVPKVQLPFPYFSVVKNGDYDGRLFIVHKDGEIFDLIGGFYFLSENRRYIFSHYASDSSGLAVFDLKERRVVFSSVELPAHQHQWYILKGTYYFTAPECPASSGIPTEKVDVAYFYNLRSHKIIKKKITKQEVEASKPVVYEFDPRSCEDCIARHNLSILEGNSFDPLLMESKSK